ncbi:MAG: S8 family peptidase [Candidatus Hodarchaeales archaeon]|jgi:hypothetical protein
MVENLMLKWKKICNQFFIIILIWSFIFLSSLQPGIEKSYQPQPIFNFIDPSSKFSSTSDVPKELSSVWNINDNFLSNDITIGNINESFYEIYALTNPQLPIGDGPSGENVTIAILDSGINNNNSWIGNSVKKYSTTNSSQVDDDNGHGTFVGSIIAKIAPKANLISIKVTDASGFGEEEWIRDGFHLALSLNVSIIHASFGTRDLTALNSSLFSFLMNQNITTVIAAGNDGPFGSSLSSPAIFPEVIAVGMAHNRTYVSPSSSYGPRPSGLLGPDLVAPGVNITSYNHNGEPKMGSGSSFSAPFVTGALALLKETVPSVTPIMLKTVLLETANFMNYSSPVEQGNGFLDISKAFQKLMTIQSEPLFTFAPRQLSSYFTYFGHVINGVDRTYRIALYSTINCTIIDLNDTQISPISVSIEKIPFNISIGLNYLNMSLKIPDDLNMGKKIGNLTFNLTNGTNWIKEFPITIENRYPGGNVLFYQGYDNDSFIPDGPTGRFSQLLKFLEFTQGLQTRGAIRSNGLHSGYGPLMYGNNNSGRITNQDLQDQNILVLADLEFEITDEEIAIIQRWVDEGHSLLVLSYPSLTQDNPETLSNQESVNKLLSKYGLEFEYDSTPSFSRFNQAEIQVLAPIFAKNDILFDYNGTSVKINEGGKILATAKNQISATKEEVPVAAFWEDPDSHGKVVVFGGMLPFEDTNVLNLDTEFQNFHVIDQIFQWMIEDQQLSLDILFTTSPRPGMPTTIQITVNNPDFDLNGFNGTIIEGNYSFTQIYFEKSINVYIATWEPLTTGSASLWLNLESLGKVPTNGPFNVLVIDNTTPDLIFLLLGGFVLMAVIYYFISSTQPKSRSPIEERVAQELQKQKSAVKHPGLETHDICPKCQTPRYEKVSKYCFKCGGEL